MILIELTTGQERTISSEGVVVEVVLSDEFIAWTSVEEPIDRQIYHILVHDRATGSKNVSPKSLRDVILWRFLALGSFGGMGSLYGNARMRQN